MDTQLLSKKNSILSAVKRVLFTILCIFVYVFIYDIKYPGITENIVESKAENLIFSSLTSIMSQSIRPVIMSNIIMGIMSIISKEFESMRKTSNYKQIFDISSLLLTILISIIMSISYSKSVINYVDLYQRSNFLFKYIVINIMSSLFVLFFNRQILVMGTGSGISFMISIRIISDLLHNHNITQPKYIFITFIIFLIACFMDSIKIHMPVYALKSDSSGIKDEKSIISIKNRPLNNCVIANILANQFMYMSSYIYKFDIVNTFINKISIISLSPTISSLMSNIMYTCLIILFSYISAFAYSNNAPRISNNVRQSLCIFTNVRIGKEISYIENVSMISAIISGICTIIMIYISSTIKYIFHMDVISGINALIVVSSIIGIINFSKSVYYYTTYSFPSDILVKKYKKTR